jgi:SPP1 family predicted phage head-tail adaptor
MLGSSKKPAIDEMRERVTFESLSTTSDGQGGVVESWVTYWTCWCAIKMSRGFEENFANKIRVVYDRDLYIRRKDGLDTTMRVLFKGKYWQVKKIEYIDEEQFYQKISVVENVGT